MESFEENEACAYMLREIPEWSEMSDDVCCLVRRLERFPLALKQVAAYAQSEQLSSPQEYLAVMDKARGTCLRGVGGTEETK